MKINDLDSPELESTTVSFEGEEYTISKQFLESVHELLKVAQAHDEAVKLQREGQDIPDTLATKASFVFLKFHVQDNGEDPTVLQTGSGNVQNQFVLVDGYMLRLKDVLLGSAEGSGGPLAASAKIIGNIFPPDIFWKMSRKHAYLGCTIKEFRDYAKKDMIPGGTMKTDAEGNNLEEESISAEEELLLQQLLKNSSKGEA
jgi:hypothetical protein